MKAKPKPKKKPASKHTCRSSEHCFMQLSLYVHSLGAERDALREEVATLQGRLNAVYHQLDIALGKVERLRDRTRKASAALRGDP
jgi:hypothetical protein